MSVSDFIRDVFTEYENTYEDVRAARLLQEHEIKVFVGLCSVLEPRARAVFWRRYIDELTLEKIGESFFRSRTWSEVRLRRGGCEIRQATDFDWAKAVELGLQWFQERGLSSEFPEKALEEQKAAEREKERIRDIALLEVKKSRTEHMAKRCEEKAAALRRRADDYFKQIRKLRTNK